MVPLLFWSAVFLKVISPLCATPPPLPDFSSREFPAEKLVYSYSSAANISRGIRANLSAEVSAHTFAQTVVGF